MQWSALRRRLQAPLYWMKLHLKYIIIIKELHKLQACENDGNSVNIYEYIFSIFLTSFVSFLWIKSYHCPYYKNNDQCFQRCWSSQAVSCLLITTAARIRSQVTSSGICGGECSTGGGEGLFRFPCKFSCHKLLRIYQSSRHRCYIVSVPTASINNQFRKSNALTPAVNIR